VLQVDENSEKGCPTLVRQASLRGLNEKHFPKLY